MAHTQTAVRRSATPPAETQTLARRLGPYDAAAIIVSNVIGGGILFTPPQVAASVQNPWLFLATWVAGGLLAFAGAMAYAELAALRPRAGGEYVYLRAAFGRLAAFLTGWTSFVAGFSGAIAASAVVLAFYVGRFVPAASDATPLLVIPLPFVPLTISRQAIVALAAIGLMAWVHIRGVGTGALRDERACRPESVGAPHLHRARADARRRVGVEPGAGGGARGRRGVAAGAHPGDVHLLGLERRGVRGRGDSRAGPERAAGARARHARRRRDLLLLNLLFLYVLPVNELAQVRGSVLDVVADRLLGIRAGDVMGIVSIISIAASISAMTFAGPRVYYAMARDGLFFRGAARVHPRYQTPAASIVAQAVWSGLLVLSGGANALTTYTGFAVVLFAGVAVVSLFVLRQREPDAPRPFRAWGYPVAPAIFATASLAIVLNALWADLVVPMQTGAPWGPAAAGILIIALGIPLYFFFSRRQA